jgi:lipopolysaccharide export system protein LptC
MPSAVPTARRRISRLWPIRRRQPIGVTNMYAYCVMTNHPWAYWKFEETNDTLTSSMQAYDYSGHNFDATYGNSDGTARQWLSGRRRKHQSQRNMDRITTISTVIRVSQHQRVCGIELYIIITGI